MTRSASYLLAIFVCASSCLVCEVIAGTTAPALHERVAASLASDVEEDGLPSNAIEALCFDREGRVWAATEDGPAVYDGHAWTTIALPAQVSTRFLRAALAASDGSLWFGSDGSGLLHFKDGEWTIITA